MGHLEPILPYAEEHSMGCDRPVFAGFSCRRSGPSVELVSSSRGNAELQSPEINVACPTSYATNRRQV